jgi:hypothetical protein
MLTQAIAGAVDFTCEHRPEVAEEFTRKLAHFEHCLNRLRLTDEDLAHFPRKRHLLLQSLVWLVLGLVFLPVAIYGWMHRALPLLAVNWTTRRMAGFSHGTTTHISTTAILAGAVSFGVCYGVYIAIVHAFFGFPVSLWYGLSLPVAGLTAHWYLRGLRRFAASLRCVYVLFRAPSAARHLLELRDELTAQIESARWQVPAEALTPNPTGPL